MHGISEVCGQDFARGGFRDQLAQDVHGNDVRPMRIALVGIVITHAKYENIVLDRMGRVKRHDFHAVAIVPVVGHQIANIKNVVKQALVHRHQRSQLLGHRMPHQRRGEVLDAVPGCHQGWQTGEMVVVGMRMKDALDFADIDAQRLERIDDAGACIHKVIAALEHDNACHALPAQIPAVALPAMYDAEILGVYLVVARRIGRFVGLTRRQVEVNLHTAIVI